MNELRVIRKYNKDNKQYIALIVDLGYVRKFLSFNPQEIAEICGLSVRELYDALSTTDAVTVGEIKL